MPVSIASGLSTVPDARTGALEAARAAHAQLRGDQCDLAIVFASGAHLGDPEATLAAVHEALEPAELAGCGAGGGIAGGGEGGGGAGVAGGGPPLRGAGRGGDLPPAGR